MIKKIVIVGGGTAGWLTAGIIAAKYRHQKTPQLRVTLIESPDVNTIGVGEGTWPTMRSTLKKIGLSETEFIKTCNASFKQGSKFVGWRTGGEQDSYYHPFTIPQGYAETNIYAAWCSSFSQIAFADAATVQGQICERRTAPKQITTPEYAGVLNYGYHLDAAKFAELLKTHCKSKLGVDHIVDHVCGVNADASGDILSLNTKQSGPLDGDLFIDCSGVSSLLIDKHYAIPFISQEKYSLNDSAIAAQVPYGDDMAPIASATIATAQSAGWTWDIGLGSRRGVGYVYSSKYISDDNAEIELRKYIAKSAGEKQSEAVSVRKIGFIAGHRQTFWYRNCVAIGMAAGFIEPLEASALALVELSANLIRDELPMTRATMEIIAARFNRTFTYRWQRIVEFLKLHYVLSERRDTEYWQAVTKADSLPDGLREMLALWEYRPPYYHDLLHSEEIFPSASYQYVLYGMGFKTDTDAEQKQSNNINLGVRLINENLKSLDKYVAVLPTTRELIEAIKKYGMQKI